MSSVLVTGASTGIGRAIALRLDAEGWRVFAGVRREQDAEALRTASSGQLEPVMLDITDAAQITAVVTQLSGELDGGLGGLVNNAGVAIPSPLETMPIEDFRRQIEVNLTGQVAVTQAMLPLIRTAKGRIAFIGSLGGRMAFPMMGAYHAAKYGVEAIGDVFRRELRPTGIMVSVIEPGAIDSQLWDTGERAADEIGDRVPAREELYGEMVSGFFKMSKVFAQRATPPTNVAQAVEHALSAPRPRTHYLVGLDAKLGARLNPFIPARLLDGILDRVGSYAGAGK